MLAVLVSQQGLDVREATLGEQNYLEKMEETQFILAYSSIFEIFSIC